MATISSNAWKVFAQTEQKPTLRQIVNLRTTELQRSRQSLAVPMIQALRDAVEAWTRNPPSSNLRSCQEFVELRSVLLAVHAILSTDPVLAEEAAREGMHHYLTRIMSDMQSCYESEDDSEAFVDDVMETATNIADLDAYFPRRGKQLIDLAELERRMPWKFSLNNEVSRAFVYIQQRTERQNEQGDVGFVLWPSAVILTHYLIRNSGFFGYCTRILELGAGCGLAGITAATLCRHSPETCTIYLTDFNASVIKNLQYNIALNEVEQCCVAKGLDFYQQLGTRTGNASGWSSTDASDVVQPPVDVVLAADVICQESDATAVAKTIHDAIRPGSGKAYCICADGNHRYGVECFPRECRELGLTVESRIVPDEDLLSCQDDLQRTSGYVDGMKFTLWVVTKLA